MKIQDTLVSLTFLNHRPAASTMMNLLPCCGTSLLLLLILPSSSALAWSVSRRDALAAVAATTSTALAAPLTDSSIAWADDELPDTFDVDSYLKTGFVQNPMGVSGQAGKSRPELGVLLRDGTEVQRNARTGNVLAELLLQDPTKKAYVPILASFDSPWPLATGSVFDVECRDASSGESVFVAVTPPLPQPLAQVSNAFLTQQLFAPTGRFSFYGPPTDIQVKTSPSSTEQRRVLDLKFSTLSQSTQTEIPRKARLVAVVPSNNTNQAVLLVGSSSASRWKASQPLIDQVLSSFRAVPAPPSNLQLRPKAVR